MRTYIYFEHTGGGISHGKTLYSIRLFDKKTGKFGQYDIDGRRYEQPMTTYKYTKIDESELPEDFLYSFYHGQTRFDTYTKSRDPLDMLNESNWTKGKRTENDVKRHFYLKNLVIKTPNDIKKYVKDLRNGGYVPMDLMVDVVQAAGFKISGPHRGEIGFMQMEIIEAYSYIIRHYYNENTEEQS